ncbi:MAG: hypothetical protein H0V26_11740 [Solirubrobacterales bacterium]|nr:hypothetical protein [Solirubrobacterales bacterium]
MTSAEGTSVSDRRTRTGPLLALGNMVRALGGLLAGAVFEPDPVDRAEHGALAAQGPRSADAPAVYALLVEAIREGYLQHYGTGRVVRPADPDLALLAGDRLYALGLARLAEMADLDAVVQLADVISLSAQAHAEAHPEVADEAWRLGALAVGAGATSEHEAAKADWRRGATRA